MTVGTKFTEKQETAIEACGQFIIVSAAAGSGKTTVLIEKLIRLLSDEKNGIRADQLIIVTFTNDEAAVLSRSGKDIHYKLFLLQSDKKPCGGAGHFPRFPHHRRKRKQPHAF